MLEEAGKMKLKVPVFSDIKKCKCGVEYVGDEDLCPDCHQKEKIINNEKDKVTQTTLSAVDKKKELLAFMDTNEYFNTITANKRELFINKVYDIYSDTVNLILEFKQIDLWLSMNDNKRYVCYDRFILNWLSRAIKNKRSK